MSRDAILARRARFIAAALAAVGTGGAASCDSESQVCLSMAFDAAGGTAGEAGDADDGAADEASDAADE